MVNLYFRKKGIPTIIGNCSVHLFLDIWTYILFVTLCKTKTIWNPNQCPPNSIMKLFEYVKEDEAPWWPLDFSLLEKTAFQSPITIQHPLIKKNKPLAFIARTIHSLDMFNNLIVTQTLKLYHFLLDNSRDIRHPFYHYTVTFWLIFPVHLPSVRNSALEACNLYIFWN